MDKQHLSIVYITSNRCKEILRSIQSCLDHTSRSFELVVVDNNSSDSTQEAVESFCYKENIQLNYIYLNQNTGVSHARNIGFQQATGDILFFIDDDAVVISDNDSLDLVCDYMRSHDDVFAATGVSIDYRFNGVWPVIKSRIDKDNDYFQIFGFVGFNHFIKKTFTKRDYIYPDNLFYGSEELYMALSVLSAGGKIKFISNHVVKHNPSKNTRINPYEGKKNGHVNTYVIKKYFLPFPINILSQCLFYLRIFRFTKCSLSETKVCIKLTKERYDSCYENKMNSNQIKKAIKMFSLLRII